MIEDKDRAVHPIKVPLPVSRRKIILMSNLSVNKPPEYPVNSNEIEAEPAQGAHHHFFYLFLVISTGGIFNQAVCDPVSEGSEQGPLGGCHLSRNAVVDQSARDVIARDAPPF